MAVLYQTVRPKCIYKGNRTVPVILRNTYTYRSMHAIEIEENGHEFEGESGVCIGAFGGRKEKE